MDPEEYTNSDPQPSEMEGSIGEKPTSDGVTPSQISLLEKQIADLQSQLKRVNAESADRRHKLNEFEAKEAERLQAQMTVEEKLAMAMQEIKDREKSLSEISGAYEEASKIIEGHLQSTISSLNIPSYVLEAIQSRPASEQLDFINSHRESFAKPTAADFDAGKTGKRAMKIKSLNDLSGRSTEWINEHWEEIKSALE